MGPWAFHDRHYEYIQTSALKIPALFFKVKAIGNGTIFRLENIAVKPSQYRYLCFPSRVRCEQVD